MMFSCTSEVPPSMEFPLERSQPRVSMSSAGEKPSPLQPSPAAPRTDIRISARRLFISLA
jgi:hypothetical protein